MAKPIIVAPAYVKDEDGNYHEVPMFGTVDVDQLENRLSELEEELSGIRTLIGEGVTE